MPFKLGQRTTEQDFVALYRIDHQGHFGIAGLKHTENGDWAIDDIRGPGNADASEEVKAQVLAWLIQEEMNANPE